MAIIQPLKKIFNWETAHDHVYSKIVYLYPASNIVLDSVAHKTIYMIKGIVTSDISFTLSAQANPLPGDQIILCSRPDSTAGDITYSYDANNFYLTQCSSPVDPPESVFDNGSQQEDVTIFTFNGTKFCSTFDNC